MEKDSIHRFLFEGLNIRGAFVSLDHVWQAMLAGRNYPVVVEKLLGEMAVTLVLLADYLKEEEGRLSMQFSGNGAVPLLLIDCDKDMNIRGMARHSGVTIRDTSLRALIGDAVLQLILDAPSLNEPYRSLVSLSGDTVAQTFEHYLDQSRQSPARFFLAADAQRAVGFLLQKMPDSEQCDPDGWNRITLLAATAKPEEILSLDADALLPRLFPGENIHPFIGRAISHQCSVDQEKITNLLRSLGRTELETIMNEQGSITVVDDMFNQEYFFDRETIMELLLEMPEGSSSVH